MNKSFRERLDRYLLLENNYNEAMCSDYGAAPKQTLERLSLLSELQKDALLDFA